MKEATLSLLSDRAVQLYFAILGLAIHRCVKIYYRQCSKSKHVPSVAIDDGGSSGGSGGIGSGIGIGNSSKVNNNDKKSPSIIPLLLSALIIGITWTLILRFILTNLHTSTSYFDDAYKDVLLNTGHYFTSTQLLTWAIVVVVWAADEDCDIAFFLFGFLGAMGASFVIWVTTLYQSDDDVKSFARGASRRSNRDTSIPITYLVTSIIAFVSILQLEPCDPSVVNECTPDEGFGTFYPNFRGWLQCLHVILVVPIFISFLVSDKSLPRIESSILFGMLAIGIGGWHAYQMSSKVGANYTLPITDCQFSITTDLVCCTCITLYAVCKDSMNSAMRRRKVLNSSDVVVEAVDNDVLMMVLIRVSVATIALPLVSPAAVLATHLCLCRLGDSYSSLVAYMQRKVALERRGQGKSSTTLGSKLDEKIPQGQKKQNENEPSGNGTENLMANGAGDNAEKLPAAKWCNLGLWSNECEYYDQACENLANELGHAAKLNSSDAVLCCGCGSIDEVRHYKNQFQLRHVTGIDPHLAEGRRTDENDSNVRTLRASVEDLAITEKKGAPLFPPRLFDKVLALDNVYHYPSKYSFFSDCHAMLPGGGKVAVSDIVLKDHSDRGTPFWVKMALRLMGIPACNLWSVDQYRNKLASMGYENDVTVQLVGEQVFKGWSFLPTRLLKHLDYALIVATKPAINIEPPKKKRVAIIGSGLAGLSSAHYLLTSKDAADFDVDIYEANDRPGLAGNTELIGEQLVDVPARMACLGYYDQYMNLLEELDIPTTVVRTDSSFYGSDGRSGHVCHGYGQNSFVNVYNAIFIGGLGKLWQMASALSKLNDDIDGHEEQITFGEWMQRNLGVSSEAQTSECKTNGVDKQPTQDLPSLTCHSNPFAYIMCGSLAWMLSCTWSDLWNYPADIVLPYCRGLKMDRLGVGREGQVVRVLPSIKALERALLYGVRKLHLGSRVAAMDGTKVVNEVKYDAVIVATEAKAVSKIVRNCSEVFDKFKYHPSTIYLHTDPTFMPPNKRDWKCWNVEMSSGRKEPQLTFWLNEFYPDSNFDGHVFQTWAPTHAPVEETIITRSDFERVVHSKETRSYITEIGREQGNDGIYYAGSYCVYGMGLLEQALVSGKEASDRVLNDLLAPPKDVTSLETDVAPLKAMIIGAGPSGLVAAKYLLESKNPTYDVTIVESSDSIGGSFMNKVYDNCRLVSSKYLTAFSDDRMSEDTEICPDHPSTTQYVDYLKSYAERFGLRQHIHFGSTVVSVKDAESRNDVTDNKLGDDSNGYEVQYNNHKNQIITGDYDVVAVCSGLHNIEYVPKSFLPSSSDKKNTNIATKFKGQIIHSSQYKNPSIFAEKRVLILGCGETAMDIAHRAVSNPQCKSVALSVRRGFLSIPHNLAKDRPLDVFITNLFEHAYEHPWVHAYRLRWVLSTVFIRLFLFLTGSSLGFNQWAVQTGPVKRGYHIINKSHAAMGHLNVPVKRKSLWGRFWMWVYQEGGLRPIESFHKTEVTEVEDDGVTVIFGDGRKYAADLIVLATGYKQSFPFLDDKIRKEFREESVRARDEHNSCGGDMGKYSIEEEHLPKEHFIISKTRPHLGFIGFVRPNVGAIPPMSELQVMWWLEKMRGNVKTLDLKPGTPPSYMVLGRKYPYGVDYGNYMHRVAEDIDAAPTLSTLAKSSRPLQALYTYCIGQSMVSLFRLQGPYESKICWRVATGELWRVCMKRGFAENCGLLYMTWLSFLMNAIVCTLECLWCILTLKKPKFFVRY